MKGRIVLTRFLLSVSVCLSISFLTVSAADLDIPIVVKWENGVPYDLDGPVEVYKESVWVRDKSSGRTRFVLIDKQYRILEERDELERADKSGQEDGSGSWFMLPENGKTGTLAVSAILPDELLGKDVVVAVSSGEGVESLYLRQVNGYVQTELVPAGTYRLFEAKILGDVMQKYDPVYDDGDIVISEKGYGHIQIEFREDVGAEHIEETNMETESEKNGDGSGFMSPAKIIVFFIACSVIILCIAFAFITIKQEME